MYNNAIFFHILREFSHNRICNVSCD